MLLRFSSATARAAKETREGGHGERNPMARSGSPRHAAIFFSAALPEKFSAGRSGRCRSACLAVGLPPSASWSFSLWSPGRSARSDSNDAR